MYSLEFAKLFYIGALILEKCLFKKVKNHVKKRN
jgi:hypothetical protein